MLQNRTRLLIRYQVEGEIKPDSKLILRPFFAFRSISETCRSDLFVNNEVFLIENQFRFLPFPDVPEIYMFFSAGQFVNAPMWYHNFYYRSDSDQDNRKEDLLNPGFFEIDMEASTEILLSIGLEEISQPELEASFQREKEIRTPNESYVIGVNKLSRQLFKRLQNYKVSYSDHTSVYISELPYTTFNLSVHCFISRRILRSSIGKEQAKNLYNSMIDLLDDKDLTGIVKGEDSSLVVDEVSLFAVIFFLYEYHIRYDQGESVGRSLKIIQELINLIYKNRVPFYRIKRNKMLEKHYSYSGQDVRRSYQRLYPVKQNFLINVFWFNIIKIAAHLAVLKNESGKKFERHAKKIQKRFFDQYLKSFMEDSTGALENYPFALHPSMIYAITLPFPILNKSQSRILFTVLVKQFMTANGIKFPVKPSNFSQHIISPLLLGEFLDAWQLLMADKRSFYDLFVKISEGLKQSLHEGMVGYLPDVLLPSGSSQLVKFNNSGLATAETLYFFTRLTEIKQKEQSESSETLSGFRGSPQNG